ncbi:MAG: aldolase/citrate lyase family protein [Rhizobiaceae bacterium]
MRANPVRQIWKEGGTAVNGWASIPSAYCAEVLGHQGLDAVTVDMQHGMVGFDTAVTMFQAISATPAVPFARVERNDLALVNKLLDAGAYGIICPMVSTPDDARRFAAACRYPPHGNRSFGPARGLLYGGADYFARADEEIVALAMIETQDGLDNLDAIVATEGIDGIYVGPNDLCLALGAAPRAESDDPRVVDAIRRVVDHCRSAGKAAGIFCSSGEGAAMRAAQGFNFVTPGNDAALLGRTVRAEAAAARLAAAPQSAPPSSGY